MKARSSSKPDAFVVRRIQYPQLDVGKVGKEKSRSDVSERDQLNQIIT
jgi:hypothetical protein